MANKSVQTLCLTKHVHSSKELYLPQSHAFADLRSSHMLLSLSCYWTEAPPQSRLTWTYDYPAKTRRPVSKLPALVHLWWIRSTVGPDKISGVLLLLRTILQQKLQDERAPNERQKRDLCHPETCWEVDRIDQCSLTRHSCSHSCDGSRQSNGLRELLDSQSTLLNSVCHFPKLSSESGAAIGGLTVAQRFGSQLGLVWGCGTCQRWEWRCLTSLSNMAICTVDTVSDLAVGPRGFGSGCTGWPCDCKYWQQSHLFWRSRPFPNAFQ